MKVAGESAHAAARRLPGWLEAIAGQGPVLLLAPHGGRAGAAARACPNPRINDLHTAELTRELARRLAASALINRAMDRNQIDCNRIDQLLARAPLLLELLAEALEQIVARHGHAVVLVIHGWNVIEPRVDFGLGARIVGEQARPVGAAHLSASPWFLAETLAPLCARLEAIGVGATLGYRYPAGGRHNLLQALTSRYVQSPDPALRRIAQLTVHGAIQALQIELSVALRWPGPRREQILGLLSESFNGQRAPRAESGAPSRSLGLPATPPMLARSARRFGLECYDSRAGVGIIASFDLDGGGGARLALLRGGRLWMFTADGVIDNQAARLTAGPLQLSLGARELTLSFCGPMLQVGDTAAYTRLEQAFAAAQLEPEVELEVRFTPDGPMPSSFLDARELERAHFGCFGGTLTSGEATTALAGAGRCGPPLANPLDYDLSRRCSLWGMVEEGAARTALEVVSVERLDGRSLRARQIRAEVQTEGSLQRLVASPRLPGIPPRTIEGRVRIGREVKAFVATPRCFMAMARPAADGARLYLSVGFADLRIAAAVGIAWFECADRVDSSADPAQSQISD